VIDGEGRTADGRVFAGGDAVNGGASVVEAVAHGKRAALAIDQALR
jgi:glutamate synthase (NADPH/NADH) small chain